MSKLLLFDETLQAKIASWGSQQSWLGPLKTLTENKSWGWLFFAIILGLVFFLWSRWHLTKNEKNFWRTHASFAMATLLLLFFASLSDFIGSLLKQLFARPKPHVSEAAIAEGISAPFSFPSSHAMNLFFLSTLLFLYSQKLKSPQNRRRWRTLALSFFSVATLVAFSRVLVNEHYPSDVLAGMGAGILLAIVALKPFQSGIDLIFKSFKKKTP